MSIPPMPEKIPVADWNPPMYHCPGCDAVLVLNGVLSPCPECGVPHPQAQGSLSAPARELVGDDARNLSQNEIPPPQPLLGPGGKPLRIKMVGEQVVLPPDAKLDAMSALEQRFLTLVQQYKYLGDLFAALARNPINEGFCTVANQYEQMGIMLESMAEVLPVLREQV